MKSPLILSLTLLSIYPVYGVERQILLTLPEGTIPNVEKIVSITPLIAVTSVITCLSAYQLFIKTPAKKAQDRQILVDWALPSAGLAGGLLALILINKNL